MDLLEGLKSSNLAIAMAQKGFLKTLKTNSLTI